MSHETLEFIKDIEPAWRDLIHSGMWMLFIASLSKTFFGVTHFRRRS